LTSFLRAPTSDELDFDQGGKVRFFLGGAVYWWGDTGAMAVPNNRIAIRYSGFNCFGKSDGPGDDEPYFTFGVIAPDFKAEPPPQTRIYENVSEGTNVPDSLELFRGAPVGIAIDVTLIEHDNGDPIKYRSVVERGSQRSGAARHRGTDPGAGSRLGTQHWGTCSFGSLPWRYCGRTK